MWARLPGNVNGRLCAVEAMCFERDQHIPPRPLLFCRSTSFIATVDGLPSEVTVDTLNPVASYG